MTIYSKESLESLRKLVRFEDVLDAFPSSELFLTMTRTHVLGQCPICKYTQETFFMDIEKQYYKCNHCEMHGDVLSFLMAYCLMSYSDSIDFLSKFFNHPMEVISKESESPKKVDILDQDREYEKKCKERLQKPKQSETEDPIMKYIAPLCDTIIRLDEVKE